MSLTATISAGPMILIAARAEDQSRFGTCGMPDNQASDRRHGSAPPLGTSSTSHPVWDENAVAPDPPMLPASPIAGAHSSVHAAKPLAATGGRDRDHFTLEDQKPPRDCLTQGTNLSS